MIGYVNELCETTMQEQAAEAQDGRGCRFRNNVVLNVELRPVGGSAVPARGGNDVYLAAIGAVRQCELDLATIESTYLL
jgi:hypothetical protein